MGMLLDGKAVARVVKAEVAVRAGALSERGVTVRIAFVRVGDDPASESYVRGKSRACRRVGIESEIHHVPATIPAGDLLELVRELNDRRDVHGILVQLPLPVGHDPDAVTAALDPAKDVDGLHALNVGRMTLGQDAFVPCTPLGVRRLLSHYDIPVAGREVVILGRSNLVGRPLATLLSRKSALGDATVTLVHSRSGDLAHYATRADVLVAAIGQPERVGPDMVRAGAVVVDVGIHRRSDGQLVGDVQFEAVRARASAITPVPGGVGPMTVAMLLENAVTAAERQCR